MAPRNSNSTNGRRLFTMSSFRRQGGRNKSLSSPGATSLSSSAFATSIENAGSTTSSLKRDNDNSSVTKGWLYKWTNYIKGYQKRWFILENGLLHYYRRKTDVAKKCRRSISLHKGHIFTEEGCNFVVSNAGGSQIYHLRATSEAERQKWVTAMERAKSKSITRVVTQNNDIHFVDSNGVEKEDIEKEELIGVLGFLSSKLEELRMCDQLVNKHRHALQQSLNELEITSKSILENVPEKDSSTIDDLKIKIKTVNERSTLLNITGNAMINVSSEFLEHCQKKGKRWQSILENEREIRQNLQEMVQQLAKQHSRLESVVEKEHLGQHEISQNIFNNIQLASRGKKSKEVASGSEELGFPVRDPNVFNSKSLPRSVSTNCLDSELGDDSFEDALDDTATCFNVPVPPSELHSTSSEESIDSSEAAKVNENINLWFYRKIISKILLIFILIILINLGYRMGM